MSESGAREPTPTPGITVGSGTITDAAADPKTQVVLEAQAAKERGPLEHPLFEDATKKVQSIMDQKVQKIRTDATIDDHERRLQIREEYTKAEQIMAQARAAYENELRLDVEESEKGLFQVDGVGSANLRDAYELVHNATQSFDFGTHEGMSYAQEELERYAERARRTGDKALETAVGHIALERGIPTLREDYLSGSKARQQAWERYNVAARTQADWNDSHRNAERTLRGVGVLLRPEEL